MHNEIQILNYLLGNDSVIEQTRRYLQAPFFADTLRSQVRLLLEYYDTYGKRPPFDFVDTKLIPKLNLQEIDEQYAISTIKEFCRYKLYEQAIYASPGLIEAGHFNKLDELMRQAQEFDTDNEDPWGVVHGDEIGGLEPPEYLSGRWLVKDSVTAVYGAPGAYKSFFVLDASMRLATGLDGARKTGVCYVAAEGARGINLRAEAWREFHGVAPERNDIIFFTKPIVLTDDVNVSSFIRELKRREARTGIKIGLIVIDTLSQCMPGADENAAMSMSVATMNMIRIRRELEATVIFVHHSGKDASKEMRGSSVIKANTDAMIEVTRNGTNGLAIVQRQKDGPIGLQMPFLMEEVVIPRLAGRELGKSLVVDHATGLIATGNPNSLMKALKKKQKDHAFLCDVAEAILPGAARSVHLLLCDLGLPSTSFYKEKILELIPIDQEVEVQLTSGKKVTLTHVAGVTSGAGQIKRLK